jgi:hypothetical protein
MQPVSLGKEQLAAVMALAEPLATPDRNAFLVALATLLRHEPQPIGDGAVFRAARQLLATGRYVRNSAVATGAGPGGKWSRS